MNYFTIKEVAEELKVSERTVKRWIADKKLEVVSLPARVTRITRQAIDDMIKNTLER